MAVAAAASIAVLFGPLPSPVSATDAAEYASGGPVECRIDEDWDLVQQPRFSPPIQCVLSPGATGMFTIDPAVVLAAAIELGANDDGGDVVWIEA
ncbi:MAG: hypothetical protein AAGF73_02850 [Actinomycetota bacterium]